MELLVGIMFAGIGVEGSVIPGNFGFIRFICKRRIL